VIIRARTVLCLSRPPIADGAVVLAGNRIQAVGAWRDLRSLSRRRVIDLQEVILLPGLVNAHCHLDYTDMAGALPPPKTFLDWIPLIIAAKSGWSYTDYAQSWLNGAHMLLKSGTTTVADIEAMPDLLPEVCDATPLRVFSFLEMTCIRARREPAEVLRETVAKLESLAHGRHPIGLSPHAPYSTQPELLRLTARMAGKRHWRVCTHLAESAEEFEMYREASGPMYDWLRRNDRDNSDCGLGSPVRHLERNQLLDQNLVAVHVNFLARGDAALLGRRRVHVIHCPRSHDYFRHAPFQRQLLANAGVNLCLGTDSLATVRKTGKQQPVLDMFEEMRALAGKDPALRPLEILHMATLNGARALGQTGKIGEISPRALADLIAIPHTGRLDRVADAVLAHSGPVSAGMIDGRWVIPPGHSRVS
jgi:cytosine/adenosine deaminase-related metal-dependent hydrolase